MGTRNVESTTIDIGQAVFDEAGNELGQVRGVTENGFVVATGEGIKALSIAHERAGEAGTAELMWRCGDCGEMGDIENLPDSCPECGAAAEAIYYYIDD